MAEPGLVQLTSRHGVASMLRAVQASPELDTDVLVCLAGRWLDGTVLIGWAPSRQLTDRTPPGSPGAPTRPDLPPVAFGTGWIGSIDYAGTSWFGLFETVLCRTGRGWQLESTLLTPGQLAELAAIIDRLPEPAGGQIRIEALIGTARAEHLAAVEHAITAIRAGELYQVNVCARLAGRLDGEPIDLFAAGLYTLGPDYAAYLQLPGRAVVSMSPELFLDCRPDRTLRTAPIKGTRRRTGNDPGEPTAMQLRHSSKDRAENVMIVDLMRNDLSRVCRTGSVRAEQLLRVQPAPGVWHLVSQVSGELADQADNAALIAATFPPGSVTGAPKLRALQLIDRLEPARRGLFTGTIGYLSAITGRAELSVAIRTFELVGDSLQLGVGGGITADSVPSEEWQECLVKAAPLLGLGAAGWPRDAAEVGWPAQVDPCQGVFETMLAVDAELPALADHLARLGNSYQQLYGSIDLAGLADRCRNAVAGLSGRHRLRLTVGPRLGEPLIEVAPVGELPVRIALYRYAGRTGDWRHKWADRRWLAELEAAGRLPLFTDPDGHLTETSRGNLLIVPAPGVLRTPVLDEQVLPGVSRRRLLDAAGDRGWRIELAPIDQCQLDSARLVATSSAISGVLGVDSLDGRPLPVDAELLDELRSWLG